MPNVTTQYRMFVPRRRRFGGGAATVQVLDPATSFVSGTYNTNAPEIIEVPYPDPSSDELEARFMFWSVRGAQDGEWTSDDAALHAQTNGGPMNVTAWYRLVGGGTGEGEAELETDAFLVEQDAFVEPTPIQSVNPPSAWHHSDADEFVFTTTPSDVQARDTVVDAAEHFEHWYAFDGNAAPTGGAGLHVPQ